MIARSLLGLTLVLSSLSPVFGQRKDDDAFVAEKPAIGDSLPDLTVYHPNGEELKLSSLRGHHTVLVFGCLT